MHDASTSELDSIFQHELASAHLDVRRHAALAAFRKLHPSNRITVEEFLAGLQLHKETWAVVSSLGIVDFAEALVGRRRPPTGSAPARRRTRISDEQKNDLKGAVLRVLAGKTGGLNRLELTSAIGAQGLLPQGVDPASLFEKLRQPLHELAAEGQLHTVGQKRRMKYHLGPGGK
jgi:hypothetical protein